MSDTLDKFTLPDAVQAEQQAPAPAGHPARVVADRFGARVWLALVAHPRAVWASLPAVVYALAVLWVHPPLHAFFIVGWRRVLTLDLPTLAAGIAAGWWGVTLGERRLRNAHAGGSAAFTLWLFLGLILTFTVLVLAVDNRTP